MHRKDLPLRETHSLSSGIWLSFVIYFCILRKNVNEYAYNDNNK